MYNIQCSLTVTANNASLHIDKVTTMRLITVLLFLTGTNVGQAGSH